MSKKVFKGRMKQYGGGNGVQSIHKIFGDKNFVFVGTTHTSIAPKELINRVVNFTTGKEKTCLLLELDNRMTPTDIMKKRTFDEPTTRKLVSELKKKPKNFCIGGWDKRPAILTYTNGENYQQALYGDYPDGRNKMTDLTLRDIYEVIIKKIPESKSLIHEMQKKHYDDETFKYINYRYSQISQKKIITLYDKLVQTLGGAPIWQSKRIVDLVRTQKHINLFEKLKVKLQDTFMEIADLHTLKKITRQDGRNYIVVMGMSHYNNIKKHMRS